MRTSRPRADRAGSWGRFFFVSRCLQERVKRVFGVGVIVAITALVLAACGGEESVNTDAPSAPTTATTTALDSGADSAAQVNTVAPDLGETSWNVTLYSLDSGAMTNLWPGTEITLRFGDDGTVSGFSGCNDYSGSFEVQGAYDEFVEGVRDENDGQAIRIGTLAVTEKACTSPSGVMDQETEYLNALQSTARWLIGRGNLLLRTDDGFFLVEAERDG